MFSKVDLCEGAISFVFFLGALFYFPLLHTLSIINSITVEAAQV